MRAGFIVMVTLILVLFGGLIVPCSAGSLPIENGCNCLSIPYSHSDSGTIISSLHQSINTDNHSIVQYDLETDNWTIEHLNTITTAPATIPTTIVPPVSTMVPTTSVTIHPTTISNPDLVDRSYPYHVSGSGRTLSTKLDTTVNNYFKTNSPSFDGNYQDFFSSYINNQFLETNTHSLINWIQSTYPDKGDQARVAISLVQHIPYDCDKYLHPPTPFHLRSPYETLYDNSGICEEKSLLLAHLLKELGFGVVLFDFDLPLNHMAVGIKSDAQYTYANTRYAYIESITPVIPTDISMNFDGGGIPPTPSHTYYISDGLSFDSISEEYQDAQEYQNLQVQMNSRIDQMNVITSEMNAYPYDSAQYIVLHNQFVPLYDQWATLQDKFNALKYKYGIPDTSGCGESVKSGHKMPDIKDISFLYLNFAKMPD